MSLVDQRFGTIGVVVCITLLVHSSRENRMPRAQYFVTNRNGE